MNTVEKELMMVLCKVEQEQQELNTKILRLGNFLKKYKTINEKHRGLLKAQYKIMLQYSMILDMRIENLIEEME